MKLIGWFNQRIRLKGVAVPFKGLTTGNSGDSCHKDGSRSQKGKNRGDIEDILVKEVSPMSSHDLFDGLLYVGTLGSELFTKPPPISKFAFPLDLDTIIEDETENDSKVYNNEVEPPFEEEARNESNELTGKGPFITVERPQAKEVKTHDLTSTKFFSDAKMIEENLVDDCVKEKLQEKKKDKSAKNLVKKMFKRPFSSKCSHSSTGADDIRSDLSTKEKVQKVLKLFYKKIHPENSLHESIDSPESNFGHNAHDGGYTQGNTVHENGSSERFSHEPKFEEEMKLNILSSSREHWINTDENYLVLEL